MNHVVWDWNGTLLDDLHLVIEAVNGGIAGFGLASITRDDYRNHYTRPVRVFYDRLFGRPVADEEWRQLNDSYHDRYRDLLSGVTLREDALEALRCAKNHGMTQSLLSMYAHQELVPLVDRFSIGFYFQRVDGLIALAGDTKARYLEEHLGAIGADPRTTLVVGDTPDDAVAAAAVGASCVLIDVGSHHRRDLELLGVPIVETLVEAIGLSANR